MYFNKMSEVESIGRSFSDLDSIKGISWCQLLRIFEPILSTIVYNREEALPPFFGFTRTTHTILAAKVYYQSSAFLIEVPEFTSQRGSAVTLPSDSPPPSKKSRID